MLRSEPSNLEFPERNRNELPLLNPIVDRTQPIEARDPTDSFSKPNKIKNKINSICSKNSFSFRLYLRRIERKTNPTRRDFFCRPEELFLNQHVSLCLLFS